MRPTHIATVLSLSGWLMAANVSAQTSRLEQIDQEKAAKATSVQPETRETGDVVLTTIQNIIAPAPPALHLTFGNFRPAAGLALGADYTWPAGDGGVWNAATAWSVKNFKQVETSVDIPALLPARLRLRPFATWNDAPDLPFHGLGIDTSLADEVRYALQTTEAGAGIHFQAARHFAIGGDASYLGIESNAGSGSTPAGGVDSSPTWLHTGAWAAFDWRTSPGYTDAGGLYRVAFHDYANHDGTFDFTRTEVDLRQFIPVLHRNWIIGLQARADITASADGQVVPFYLLPSIGGRDTLPGVTDYRFTDGSSLLLRGELRWTPSPVVDMALFLDRGTVAASAGALDLRDLTQSWGLGARFHGRTFTALRLEVAHGVEGFRFTIEPGISF